MSVLPKFYTMQFRLLIPVTDKTFGLTDIRWHPPIHRATLSCEVTRFCAAKRTPMFRNIQSIVPFLRPLKTLTQTVDLRRVEYEKLHGPVPHDACPLAES